MKKISLIGLYLAFLMALAGCGTADEPTPAPTKTVIPLEEAQEAGEPAAKEVEPAVETAVIEFVPRWQAGDSRSLELVKRRSDSEAGATRLNVESRTAVDIEVLEQTASGYVLSWTYGEAQVSGPEEALNPAMLALLGLSNGLVVEYETDERGVVSGIRNWEALQGTMFDAVDVSIDLLVGEGMGQPEADMLRDMILPLFETKEQVESFAAEDIRLYHFLYEWGAVGVAQPVTYEETLPNPFGGEAFPAQGSVQVTGDDGYKTAVTWTQALDPDEAQRIILETFENRAAMMGSDPPAEADLPDPFAIEDVSEYAVENETNWIDSLRHTRAIQIGSSLRQELTEMVTISE